MKVLVFAPHAATWIHAFPEALVAEALSGRGHEILYVACDRQFSDYCVPMVASGLKPEASPQQRSQVCDDCQSRSALIVSRFGFRATQLGTSISRGDEELIAAKMSTARESEPGSTEVLGIPAGRFASYQLLLRRKKTTLKFNSEEMHEYLLYLRATLRAAFAVRNLLESERPDRVLLYNGLYSVNSACRALADAAGIPSYFLHAGGNLAHRLQTLMLGRDHTFRYFPSLLKHWTRFASRPASAGHVRIVTDHFVELLRARSAFVYSRRKAAGFSLRDRFNVPEGRKVLVATLSSPDEEFAAEVVGARVHPNPPMFKRQSDWIRALCGFAAGREDLFLIVRVHPREFPNRREGVLSEHAEELRAALDKLPDNVVVNWPDDGVSIYDLAEETDVFLNAWSGVGKEMTLLGRPVVTYAKDVIFYPPEINYTGDTAQEYFAQVDQALADGWAPDRIVQGFRWHAVEFGWGLIHIDDGFTQVDSAPQKSLPARVFGRVARLLDPLYGQKRDIAGRPAVLDASQMIARVVEAGAETVLDVLTEQELGQSDPDEERRNIQAAIRRIMASLYPDAQAGAAPKPGTLHAHLDDFCKA